MIADDVGFLRGSGLIFCFCGVRDAIEVDNDHHSLPGAERVECSMACKWGNAAILSISPDVDADFCYTIKKDFLIFTNIFVRNLCRIL